MQVVDCAEKVHRKRSYIHTSCTSCHNICCTACVLSACAVPLHAIVSVMHGSVICEASFSELASRTHLMQRNGMSARHHKLHCLCHGRLGRSEVSCLRLSQRVTILNRVFVQYKAHSSLCQHFRSISGINDAVHNST
jgi:hypothetical protein